MSNIKLFFLCLTLGFIVFGSIHALFESFDTGDDPIFSVKMAIQTLFLAAVWASILVWYNSKTKKAAEKERA